MCGRGLGTDAKPNQVTSLPGARPPTGEVAARQARADWDENTGPSLPTKHPRSPQPSGDAGRLQRQEGPFGSVALTLSQNEDTPDPELLRWEPAP